MQSIVFDLTPGEHLKDTASATAFIYSRCSTIIYIYFTSLSYQYRRFTMEYISFFFFLSFLFFYFVSNSLYDITYNRICKGLQ